MKICSQCHVGKAKSEFSRASDRLSGVRSNCKTCEVVRRKEKYQANPQKHIDYVRKWQNKNPEKVKRLDKQRRLKRPAHYRAKARRLRLKQQYGLTETQYKTMLQQQGDKCVICKDLMSRPCIDHCHLTGTVRGLLCVGCNTAIGSLKDSPDICRQAAAYLENFSKAKR